MKTLIVIFTFMSTISFSQNIIRVKSGENIQNIIDNVNTPEGSILILDPGNYERINVFKKITIIGSGFLNGIGTSSISSVDYLNNNNTTSAGSVIMGCNIGNIEVRVNNILINRCRLNSTFTSLSINNFSGVRVSQCLIDGNISINGEASSFSIQNNIILKSIDYTFITSKASGLIKNNTIVNNGNDCTPLKYGSAINSVKVINNIFISPGTCDNRNGNNNYVTNTFAQFSNNIVRKGNYQGVDSNKFLSDMNNIFTLDGGPDSKFILSQNSPAKGAGEGSVDCGAFGGPEPYVIGGSPQGPVIEDIVVPSTVRQNDVIKIKLKAKIQN